MAIELNHTIIAAHDAELSATWFSSLFGLDGPEPFGPFWQVTTANGVGLDFSSVGERKVLGQHYAFLVNEDDFDAIYGRVRDRGLDHWADPMQRRPGEINHHHGGRGVYFLSNDGHFLEILTRPYA